MTTKAAVEGTPRQPSHYEALVEAGKLLDEVLAERDADPGNGWGLRLGAAAESAFSAVAEHRAGAEGQVGALADIVERKPALAFQVERQKREHVELYHRAKELSEEIERQLAFEQLDAESLRMETVVLRESLRLHLYRAVQLLYEAYFRDEGVGD